MISRICGKNNEQLIPGIRFLLDETVVANTVNTTYPFYRNRRFITVFTRSRHWELIFSHMNPLYVLRHYYFKIHVEDCHPMYQVATQSQHSHSCVARSKNHLSSFRVFRLNFRMYLSSSLCVPQAPSFSSFLILFFGRSETTHYAYFSSFLLLIAS
jgi:hypothetical protein